MLALLARNWQLATAIGINIRPGLAEYLLTESEIIFQ
jgi:hypothetical protein